MYKSRDIGVETRGSLEPTVYRLDPGSVRDTILRE